MYQLVFVDDFYLLNQVLSRTFQGEIHPENANVMERIWCFFNEYELYIAKRSEVLKE